MKNPFRNAALAVAIAFFIGACTTPQASTAQSAEDISENEIKETFTQLDKIRKAYPNKFVDFSQVYATLVDAEYEMAMGTHSVTLMFMPGADDPFDACLTSGRPVPATWSLTNPLVEDPNTAAKYGVVVGLAEPALGVYTGPTDATHVRCLNPDGSATLRWVEGKAEGGFPLGVKWDYTTHRAIWPGSYNLESGELTNG